MHFYIPQGLALNVWVGMCPQNGDAARTVGLSTTIRAQEHILEDFFLVKCTSSGPSELACLSREDHCNTLVKRLFSTLFPETNCEHESVLGSTVVFPFAVTAGADRIFHVVVDI